MAKTPEIDLRDTLVGQNLIINGGMDIAQRGTSFVAPASASYTLDRWRYYKVGAMSHTITQDSDVPTIAESGQYFSKSLRMNLTTFDNTISPTENCLLVQKIEGYNFRKIAGKPFTLSFWVKSTTTGIRNVYFTNSGLDRAYVEEYTINSADTWEKKIINVTAAPNAGTWNYDNGIGLEVVFPLVVGSNYLTTKGSWQTGFFMGTAAAGNGVAAGSTDFRITGVMLNEGTEALPFNLAGGNYAGELQLCQRYYEKSYNLDIAPGTSSSSDGVQAFFPNAASSTWANNQAAGSATLYKVRKRITVSPTIWSEAGVAGTCSNNRGAGFSVASVFTSESGFCLLQNTGTSQTVTNGITFHWAANAEL